jgi:hypothetical protein
MAAARADRHPWLHAAVDTVRDHGLHRPAAVETVAGHTTEAVRERAEQALERYQHLPAKQTARFNLLTSMLVSCLAARGITWGLRHRRRFGPFRDVRLGGTHVHHFVPGIALAFAAGTAGLLSSDETMREHLAIPFGVGLGLTLDESALLLRLDDVYWKREGLLSVQITGGALTLAAGLALLEELLRHRSRPTTSPAPAS